MPTQRFYNLKEEKRQIIKQAAMEECARVPYAEISINKIIKSADISRGSFYTYFEDKDDMIKYLLDDFRKACTEYVLEQIQKFGGDTISAVEWMIKDIVERGRTYPNADVYKNLLLNVGTVTNMKTFGPERCRPDTPEYQDFVHRCYTINDPKTCPFQSIEQMIVALDMITALVMKHLAEYHLLELGHRDATMREFHEQLEIIRRGLQRNKD